MGARRFGLEVLVMEYKLGMPVCLKVGKKYIQAPIFARPSGQHFSQPPYQLKWILN